MERKGFTLIELLAVITIMAIMAVIATPNIISMLNKGRKEQYVADAKNMISKAKYKYTNRDKYSSLFTVNGSCYTISITNIGLTDEEMVDVYKDRYTNTSHVKVCTEAGRLVYKIYLVSGKHCLGKNGACTTNIKEEEITTDLVIEKP